MKWVKILFVCFAAFFVFFSIDTNIVFAATVEQRGNDTYIDGQRVRRYTRSGASGDSAYIYETENYQYYTSSASSPSQLTTSNIEFQDNTNNNMYNSFETAKSSYGSGWKDSTGRWATNLMGSLPEAPESVQELVQKGLSGAFSGALKDLPRMILYGIAWFCQNVILGAAALFTGLVGMLFNFVVDQTIVNMAVNMFPGEGGVSSPSSFINIGWTVIRDIVNILFIFVILFIGIKTIIGGFESGTKKSIATLIVVALLINFSLFFTKIIIDASNIVAINFYNSMTNITSSGGPISSIQNSGIAGAFYGALKVGSIYKPGGLPTNGTLDTYKEIIITSLGGSIILIILAGIILIFSTMLISRFIVLVIVLMSSAAAAGSYILPSLQNSIAKPWWSALIGQSLFAPTFFLFLYVILVFMERTSASGIFGGNSNASWAGIFLGTDLSGASGLIMYFLIIIGLMIGALSVSKKIADMAGEGSTKMTKVMGSATLGAIGMFGRGTAGRAGRFVSESKQLQGLASSNNFFARATGAKALARRTLVAGDAAAKGSFDLRGAAPFSKLLGYTGTDLGKASESSYNKRVDAKAKEWADKSDARTKLYGLNVPEGIELNKTMDKLKEDIKNGKVKDKVYEKIHPAITKSEAEIKKANAEVKLAESNLRAAAPADKARMATELAEKQEALDKLKKNKRDLDKLEADWVSNKAAEIKAKATWIGEKQRTPIVFNSPVTVGSSGREKAFKDASKKFGAKDTDRLVEAVSKIEKK